MKKIVSLILALCMMLAFAGCGAEEKDVLKVAISPDFAPMEFVDATKSGQDSYVGFDISLVAPARHGHSKGIIVREALHRRGLCGGRFVCDNCHHVAKVVGELVVDGW